MSSSADWTPRPQHIPTLEELSVVVAAPAALDPAESQDAGTGDARDAAPASYMMQPPSLATAGMHRQLLSYMEMLLRQHHAHQQLHGR